MFQTDSSPELAPFDHEVYGRSVAIGNNSVSKNAASDSAAAAAREEGDGCSAASVAASECGKIANKEAGGGGIEWEK